MPSLWRIAADTPTYRADDLTGKGAEITGGRWNRKGTPLIYASESRALACLEALVHLAGGVPLPLNRFLVELTVPQPLWDARTRLDPTVHVGWDAEPAGVVSLDWGTHWAQSLGAVLAEVPSIVIPDESNVLVNPRHPDAAQLAARKLRHWSYDRRLR